MRRNFIWIHIKRYALLFDGVQCVSLSLEPKHVIVHTKRCSSWGNESSIWSWMKSQFGGGVLSAFCITRATRIIGADKNSHWNASRILFPYVLDSDSDDHHGRQRFVLLLCVWHRHTLNTVQLQQAYDFSSPIQSQFNQAHIHSHTDYSIQKQRSFNHTPNVWVK